MFHAIQGAWDARDEAALGTARRRRPDGRVAPPPRRLRAQGLAQPRARWSAGPDGRVRRPDEPRATTRRTASSCASARASRTTSRAAAACASCTTANQLDDDGAARVLDARQARRPLDPRLDRAGRRGRAPARRADRRLAVGATSALRDEALVEGARRRRGAPRRRDRRGRRPRLRRRRARRGARPLARRRALRARRARGRRAPRRRGVGRGGRRRGRAAARASPRPEAVDASCSTAATRATTAGSSCAARGIDGVRIAALDAVARAGAR